MKTLTLIFFVLLTFTAKSQNLNAEAQHIKTNYPEGYEIIKQAALDKWGTDFSMVVYQINTQCKAVYSVVNSFETDNTVILYQSLQQWSYEGYELHTESTFRALKQFGLNDALKFHVDWNMVLYTYNNQVKAKRAF